MARAGASKSGTSKGTAAAEAAAAKKASSKPSKRQQQQQKPSHARQQPSHRFVVCPFTDQKVFVAKATLADLKSADTYRNNGSGKKRLWTIPSPQHRQDHYRQVAKALALAEQQRLPSSGGRSWEVESTVKEPTSGRGVLFRAWKGRMELAVLPHLLERIPRAPVWPGKRHQPPDDYQAFQDEAVDEEGDYIAALASREVSTLSQVAHDVLRRPPHNHAVPAVSLRWKSPDAKSFTSRKAAWEHAQHLCEQEVLINRNLLGVGASGRLLLTFVPTLKTTLEVLGPLRFVRDGLWVVGQELSWQEDRQAQWEEQRAEREDERAQRVHTSGLQLYVATHRVGYRNDEDNECSTMAQADRELRLQWRQLSPDEQQVWNDKVREQFEDNDDDEEDEEGGGGEANCGTEEGDAGSVGTSHGNEVLAEEEEQPIISRLKYFVYMRRQKFRRERQKELEVGRFTLGQADKELRAQWKAMPEDEQDEWIEKLVKEAEEEENDMGSSNGGAVASQQASKVCDLEVAEVFARAQDAEEDGSGGAGPTPVMVKNAATTLPELEATAVSPSLASENPNDEEQKDENCSDSGASTECTNTSSDGRLEVAELRNVVSPTKDEFVSEASSTASAATDKESTGTTDADPDLASSFSIVRPRDPETFSEAAVYTENTKRTSRIQKPTAKATQRWCLNQQQIDQCHNACMEHYETVMRTVKARELSRELEDGFDVLRERGRGRFDMELPVFDSPDFDFLHDFKKTPWMPVVHAILGDDVVLIHKGCFVSLPGAGSQEYHQDGVHLTTQTQRPCHAINVFVPLVDLTSRNGPTEFCLGSHVLGHEGYDRDFLEVPKPKAGTPVIFDYRLGHRGLANSSNACRPIVYCTYARAADGKEFRDSVNFSRKRYHKIGELSGKPMSREERRYKRKRNIESKEEEKISRTLEMSAKVDEIDVSESEPAVVVDRSEC